MSERFLPLTVQQRQDYVDRAPGRIIVTVDNFRFDFNLQIDSMFNEDTLFVAAQGFRSALASGLYGGSDRFQVFLEKEGYLEACVKRHFQYLTHCYDEARSEAGRARRA